MGGGGGGAKLLHHSMFFMKLKVAACENKGERTVLVREGEE